MLARGGKTRSRARGEPDQRLVAALLTVMMAAPRRRQCYAEDSRIRWSGGCCFVECAGSPSGDDTASQSSHPISEWLPNVVNGWTGGGGYFNQLEVPDQVNAMIEGFLRHHV